ncbi:MAG: NUDIX domain-containing protein [bacterium]
MSKIFLNIDTGDFIIESKVLSYDNYSLLEEYRGEIQELSGFLVIVNDKILLVKPKKFKGISHKWSIPKGKVENGNKFDTALKELKEETGIKLPKSIKNKTEKLKIYYKKSGKLKELTTYIININEDELNIDIDNKWEVSKKHLDKDEIYKAKFFTMEEAMDKLELGQLPLIRMIKKENKHNVRYN